MRAVCIARHRFLSEHISSIFSAIGIASIPAVGFDEGTRRTRSELPDLVICDYDLLVSAPLAQWERDEQLGVVPIIAVSLTRRPEEAHFMDTNGIAGFLYLPLLDDADALRVIKAACVRGDAAGERMQGVRVPDNAFRWPPIEDTDRVRRG